MFRHQTLNLMIQILAAWQLGQQAVLNRSFDRDAGQVLLQHLVPGEGFQAYLLRIFGLHCPQQLDEQAVLGGIVGVGIVVPQRAEIELEIIAVGG